MELSLQVKNLFLQIYDFTGAESRQFDLGFCCLKAATNNILANSLPPFLDDYFCGRGYLLQQPC